MYVDEKKLEEKKNASFDVITSSLCWSHDTHSTMVESCFQQKFLSEEDNHLILKTHFNWQEEIQQLVCWPEELDDKWSQKSVIF